MDWLKWLRTRLAGGSEVRPAARHVAARPRLEALEDRRVPATIASIDFAVGVDSGPPHVKVFDEKLQEVASFHAYDPAFRGGVRVALGDVNGDNVADVITGTGRGGNSHVKIIDGTKLTQVQRDGQIADSALLASFSAFDGFEGEVFVAGGDVNGDGFDEVAVSTGPGTAAHVLVFDGAGLSVSPRDAIVSSFFAFSPDYVSGATVDYGDVNGDGFADLILGSRASSSHVKVIDGTRLTQVQRDGTIAESALLFSALAFDASFTSGVLVSAVDLDGDGRSELITGPSSPGNGNVQVRRFGLTDSTSSTISSSDPILSFFAFGDGFTGGVRVGAAALVEGTAVLAAPSPRQLTGNGNSTGGIITVLMGNNPITNLTPFGESFTGGLFVSGYVEQDNL